MKIQGSEQIEVYTGKEGHVCISQYNKSTGENDVVMVRASDIGKLAMMLVEEAENAKESTKQWEQGEGKE